MDSKNFFALISLLAGVDLPLLEGDDRDRFMPVGVTLLGAGGVE